MSRVDLGIAVLDGFVPLGTLSRRTRRRRQSLTESDWQIVQLIKRWAPDRELIFVEDSSFAALDLLGLVSLTPKTSLITRLRMDAELWDPAPERKSGQNGRPRVKGARRPSPKQRLDNPQTPWTKSAFGNSPHKPKLTRQIYITPSRGKGAQALKCSTNYKSH